MNIDLDSIFQANEVTLALARFIQAQEGANHELQSIQQDVNKLLAADYHAGVEAMHQASFANDDERPHRLRTAVNLFSRALSTAENQPVTLVRALIGRSVCESCLGDSENSWRSLTAALEVTKSQPTDEQVASLKGIGMGAGLGAVLLGPIGWVGTAAVVLGTTAYRAHRSNQRTLAYEQECAELTSLQDQVRDYLASISATAIPRANKKRVFTCPNCNQSARVSAGTGRIRVICPECGTRYECEV